MSTLLSTPPAHFKKIVTAALIGLLALSPTAIAEPSVTTFTSGTVADLHCPIVAQRPRPPSVPHLPRLPTEDVAIPTAADVGDLAREVDIAPPVLDRVAIAEFALNGSDGAARPRRFAFWGDSHIAAGPMMGQLFQAIRAHGETVGTRFLPPTMGRANVRLPTLHAYCIGTGWSTALAFTAQSTLATGPALANRVAQAGPDSYLWLDLRSAELKPQFRRVTVVYRAAAQDAALTLSVNDGAEQTVTLPAGSGSALLPVEADTLISTLKLRVSAGALTLQGFLLDYEQPPLVTLDVFGLPSSTGRGWMNADPAAIADALHGGDYDAVALEYGTNEGNELNFDPRAYGQWLAVALGNMRKVFPHASCVLIGPPDRGVLLSRTGTRRPDFLQFARIHHAIATVQAEVGARFACVPWNWQDFMGGPGASYAWVHHDPVLMGGDLTHMTMDGYKKTGAALAASLGWSGPDQSVYPR